MKYSYIFNISDDGYYSFVPLGLLVGAGLYFLYLLLIKKIEFLNNFKMFILPIVLIFFLLSEFWSYYQYRSNVNNYNSGEYYTVIGQLKSIDKIARAVEHIEISDLIFKIKQNSYGCYGILSGTNEYLTISNIVNIGYLESGCIVSLKIEGNKN